MIGEREKGECVRESEREIFFSQSRLSTSVILPHTQPFLFYFILFYFIFRENCLQRLAESLASLDALISLGLIAKERDYVCPEIVDAPVLVIEGGRHPLQGKQDVQVIN